MEVVDMELAIETYDRYRILLEELEDAIADLKEIEDSCTELKYYQSILSGLEYANKKNYGRYEDAINRFLNEHKELEEYEDLKYYISIYKKDMNFLENENICLPDSQFILLENDSKKFLVDLENLIMQDVTEYNPKLIDFIIKMLKTQGYFIGYAEPSDLPLLMNIKEDLEEDISDEECVDLEDEENRMYKSLLPNRIALEFRNAKLTDEKSVTKRNSFILKRGPFILDSNIVQEKWKELDELEPNISKEEYLLRYYKLLMIFGNSVEKVYKEAPLDEKKYVLDAYQFYSSDVITQSELIQEQFHHFRTASPVINIEILKRKVLNKK